MQRRAEIARVSVRQTLDGHGGSRGRFVGHSWGGGRHASRVATEIMGRYVYWWREVGAACGAMGGAVAECLP